MTTPERTRKQMMPRRVDAVLADTMALLELVRREEQVLVGLRGCVVELEAIRRARAVLADRTESEVVEAARALASGDGDGPGPAAAGGGWGG